MYVNICSVGVVDNPARFTDPFKFEIEFECVTELKDDLEWKIIYVGSAEDVKYDQVLESIVVGPVPVGRAKFLFQAECPDASKIPEGQLLGATVVMVTVSYKSKEFTRVGYYVNNEYEGATEENPAPKDPEPSKILRSILADKPRVTRWVINWDD